jgi:hypothetical protein
MAALCIPDEMLLDGTDWRVALVFAAVNARDHFEGRIPVRVVREKVGMKTETVLSALRALTNERIIERDPGYPTATTNPLGKKLATGMLLSVSARYAGGTYTVLTTAEAEELTTGRERYDALVNRMTKRRLRGQVKVRFERVGKQKESSVLPLALIQQSTPPGSNTSFSYKASGYTHNDLAQSFSAEQTGSSATVARTPVGARQASKIKGPGVREGGLLSGRVSLAATAGRIRPAG